jgi:hypothetical protein
MLQDIDTVVRQAADTDTRQGQHIFTDQHQAISESVSSTAIAACSHSYQLNQLGVAAAQLLRRSTEPLLQISASEKSALLAQPCICYSTWRQCSWLASFGELSWLLLVHPAQHIPLNTSFQHIQKLDELTCLQAINLELV